MWLAISTRPDISNAVRSIARYCSAPKAVHWKSTLGILAYINGNCGFGITHQRGATVGRRLRQESNRQEICARRCNYVCRGMRVLVF